MMRKNQQRRQRSSYCNRRKAREVWFQKPKCWKADGVATTSVERRTADLPWTQQYGGGGAPTGTTGDLTGLVWGADGPITGVIRRQLAYTTCSRNFAIKNRRKMGQLEGKWGKLFLLKEEITLSSMLMVFPLEWEETVRGKACVAVLGGGGQWGLVPRWVDWPLLRVIGEKQSRQTREWV